MTAERRRARRLAVTLGALAVLQGLAALVYVSVEQRRARQRATGFAFEPVSAPRTLPSVRLVRADGSTLAPSALHGATALLHFWATWCAPCKEELPGLLDLARSEPRLRLIALTLDADWAVVRTFFSGPIPPEVCRDPSGQLKTTFGVHTLPDTYLLDRSGAAALHFAGARTWNTAAARAALEPYLDAEDAR